MKRQKMDRRVKYTIMALQEALIEALQTEHISKISVKALCEAADINRSTFYAHFEDQYGLLQYIQQQVLDNIQKDIEGQRFNEDITRARQVLGRVLEYVKANAEVFKALLGDNCGLDFPRKIMSMTSIISNITYEGLDTRTREYLTVYGIMGCIALLQKWLYDGTPEPPGEMADFILRVLHGGVIAGGRAATEV